MTTTPVLIPMSGSLLELIQEISGVQMENVLSVQQTNELAEFLTAWRKCATFIADCYLSGVSIEQADITINAFVDAASKSLPVAL